MMPTSVRVAPNGLRTSTLTAIPAISDAADLDLPRDAAAALDVDRTVFDLDGSLSADRIWINAHANARRTKTSPLPACAETSALVLRGLHSGMAVDGFVLPFVDQLLRCVPSPLLWRCGATYVPRFVV